MRRRILSWIALLWGAGGVVVSALAADEGASPAGPLTTAQAVRETRREGATAASPEVALDGVVTFANHGSRAFYLQDTTAGVVFGGAAIPEDLSAGERVGLFGRVQAGGFTPAVLVTNLVRKGRQELPPARPARPEDLLIGAEDAQWITLTGVVRHSEEDAGRTSWNVAGVFGPFEAHFAQGTGSDPAGRWIGARVRIKGVCATTFNARGQYLAYRLLVNRLEDVELLDPAPRDPFELPLFPLDRALEFNPGQPATRQIKVAGVVIFSGNDRSFRIQVGDQGLLVRLAEGNVPPVGAQVEAVGFPAPGEYTLVLEFARLRLLGQGQAPTPIALDLARIQPLRHGTLVTTDATLTEVARQQDAIVLLMRPDDGAAFQAFLEAPSAAGRAPRLEPGSRLRLTGVYRVRSENRVDPSGHELRLRRWGDVTVLEGGPWWNMRRATTTALLLGLVLAGGVTWSATLRRRLKANRRQLDGELSHRLSLERCHQELTEGAPDAIYTLDAAGGIVSANPAACALTGRSEEELRAMSIYDVVAPEERERVQDRLLERFESDGAAAGFEVDVLTASGQRRTIEVTSRVIRRPDSPPLLEGVGRDVTDRRRAQDALKALLATTALASGDEFFHLVVRHLAEVLRVRLAYIGVVHPRRDACVRTLAAWRDGKRGQDFSYPLAGTPCAAVVGQRMSIHSRNLQKLFPQAGELFQMPAEAYVGLPLWDAEGKPLGVLALVHNEPFEPGPAQIDMLRIFAACAGAEIDRRRATTSLQASEERFRQLAEQTRDILWVANLPAGRLTYLSPAFTRLTGVPVERLQGDPRQLLRMIPPNHRRRVLDALRRSLAEPGARYATEYQMRRSDGSLVWILDEGVVIRDGSGRPHRLSGVARDITTRKEAELALAAERGRFRDLFENSPDAIFVEGLDGVVLDVNRAACELHGLSREQLTSRSVSDLVPARHWESVRESYERLLEGELTRLEGWSLRSDGAEIPVELQASRIRHEGREALLIHVRDIRARREAEELLAGQKRILEWIATARPLETVLAELLRVAQTCSHGLQCFVHWLPSESDLQPRAVGPASGSVDAAALLQELGQPDGPIGRLLVGAPPPAPLSDPRSSSEPLRIELNGSLSGRVALVQPMSESNGRPLGTVTAMLPRDAAPSKDSLELLRLTASLAGVALQRHRADTSLRESSDRLRTANSALLSLARSDAIAEGELGEALQEITAAAAQGIGVFRASVWLFEEEDTILRCSHAHGGEVNGAEALAAIRAADYPSYIEAFTRERFVSVSDVRNDLRTHELYPTYLAPRAIASLLDAGIRLGGRLIGVLSLEHRGSPRVWKDEEELFAGSLADLVAQTLQASQRRSMEEALRQSEEAYRSVVGILAEGVLLMNRDGAFVTFNESAAQILGRTPEFLEGHRLHDVISDAVRADGTPLEIEDFPASVTQRTGKPVSDFVLGVLRPAGDWVWLSINTRPFTRDDDGEVASVVVSFADITSRQSAERELRRGHELLRAISQTQARFIADADPARNLRHMLSALMQMTSSDSGIIGEVNRTGEGPAGFLLCAALDEAPENGSPSHLVGSEAGRHAPITEVMDEVLRSQHPVTRAFAGPAEAALVQGATPPLHLLALPLRLDGEIVGVAGLARASEAYDEETPRRMDPLLLTCANLFGAIRTARQRQEAEARIRQLNAELEQRVEERTADLRAMNEELAEFAYVVTHDLKAPLRGIHQLAEWLTHDHSAGLNEGALKLLALLRQRVLHLQRLVDGLLACARVGRSPEPETTVPISQLVQDVVEVLGLPPQVVIDIPADLPVVRGNPERLHQVFQNLMDNSVKYLNRPDGKIRVHAKRRAGAWEFHVADNGPGIPERYQEKVFQIFQRLDPKGDVPGTGLGLTLVRRIIERRGGRAWIESVEGQGTTVCFTWPDRARRRSE